MAAALDRRGALLAAVPATASSWPARCYSPAPAAGGACAVARAGVFSSPCEGVFWDSGRHCWVALPVASNGSSGPTSAPDLFAPAVLGMEGAKLEAIKRRKAMEAEHFEKLRDTAVAQGPIIPGRAATSPPGSTRCTGGAAPLRLSAVMAAASTAGVSSQPLLPRPPPMATVVAAPGLGSEGSIQPLLSTARSVGSVGSDSNSGAGSHGWPQADLQPHGQPQLQRRVVPAVQIPARVFTASGATPPMGGGASCGARVGAAAFAARASRGSSAPGGAARYVAGGILTPEVPASTTSLPQGSARQRRPGAPASTSSSPGRGPASAAAPGTAAAAAGVAKATRPANRLAVSALGGGGKSSREGSASAAGSREASPLVGGGGGAPRQPHSASLLRQRANSPGVRAGRPDGSPSGSAAEVARAAGVAQAKDRRPSGRELQGSRGRMPAAAATAAPISGTRASRVTEGARAGAHLTSPARARRNSPPAASAAAVAAAAAAASVPEAQVAQLWRKLEEVQQQAAWQIGLVQTEAAALRQDNQRLQARVDELETARVEAGSALFSVRSSSTAPCGLNAAVEGEMGGPTERECDGRARSEGPLQRVVAPAEAVPFGVSAAVPTRAPRGGGVVHQQSSPSRTANADMAGGVAGGGTT